MLSHLAPSIRVSKAADYAISLETGEFFDVHVSQRQRLLAIRSSPQQFAAEDVSLISLGLVRIQSQVQLERASLKARIEEALSQQSAIAVMPTEKCNFRCTYCYEKFEKGRMQPTIQERTRRFITRMVSSHPVNSLAWFGGEPLLQPSIIESLSAHFRDECIRYGTRGSISITSNGSLLNKRLINIFNAIELDAIQISLDGPPEIHDAQRVDQSSSTGSHDLILRNIGTLLRETSTSVVLRVNISAETPGISNAIAHWMHETILPVLNEFRGRIRYHLVPIWSATTTTITGICLTDINQIQAKLQIERSINSAMNVEDRARTIELISGFGKLACYAGLPNHYVVGADGMVYKCTVAFDLEANQIGILGDQGNIEGVPEREELWTGPGVLTDPVCGSCAFGVSCLGVHCPLTRMIEKRQPCPPQKAFFDAFFGDFSNGAYCA